MALNKRKVLDTARKHAQKGAKAKALKEYNKLLQADPRDAKLLLEVGDAYRRWGQAEDAIAQYSKVAAQYRQDGFDARAVAVFKQILNLDPKQYAAYVSLSELYQRMGLDSEAAGALQMAADGYHKEGRKAEALELLRQMGALDPSNTTNRIKVAELLRQEGMTEDALSEYEAIAAELGNQQDRDQLIVVQERILEISPNHVQTLSGLARTLMATAELDKAEPYAARAAAASPEPTQFELLMDLYAQMGNDEGLANATRALAKVYRDRGDEDKARELMQRLATDDVSSSGSRLSVDMSEVEEPKFDDDELLDDEPFLTLDDEDDSFSASSSRPSLAFEEVELDTPETPKPAAAAETAATPAGDPDQLLAEASVYLRYGKREQAVSSLQAILSIESSHRGALEKMGECHAEAQENTEAVQVWMQAVEQARLEEDATSIDRLKELISAVDPEVGASVRPLSGSAGADEDSVPAITGVGADITDTAEPGDEFDLDLDLDDAIDAVADSETGSRNPAEETASTFEIELDDDSIVFDSPPSTSTDAAENTQSSLDLSTEDDHDDGEDSIDFEIDVDLEDDLEDDLDASDFEADVSDQLADEPPDAPVMSEAQISEELEEAEFYIAQDMFDEAEAIVVRVLEAVPAHAAALVMSGEVAAGRGVSAEDQEASVVDPTPALAEDAAVTAEDTVPDTLDSEDEGANEEIGFDIDVEEDLDLDAAVEEAAGKVEEAPQDDPVSEEVGFELEVSFDEEDDEEEADLDLSAASEETEFESFEEITVDEPEPEEVVVAAESETEVEEVDTPEVDAAQAPAADEESFDLREALADVLEEDTEDAAGTSQDGVLSTVEDGFGSIFSDFKKGVTATLDDGDFDTRYDLGIAYREMGLFDDAIGEFRMCLESTDRQFDSLYLMGLCARDLGRWGNATQHLEQALALPEIPEERLAGVYFDLSVAHEGAGDPTRAISTLERVLELEADFPGAQERLATLQAGNTTLPELGVPGETYESFDDLFDSDEEDDTQGDGAIVEAVSEETYESFEDVMDVTNEITSDGLIEEDEAPSEPEVENSKKSGRRKISFV